MLKTIKPITLILSTIIVIIAMSFFSAVVLAAPGIQHGVNGHVSNCGADVDVNGASVTFKLAWPNGSSKAGNTLTDIVGPDGKSGKYGWYAADAGNFDEAWQSGDIVLITISTGSYSASTNVTLTEAGNDQAFTICLGPVSPDDWGYSCACGNGICEWWAPLCENTAIPDTIFVRCPEDCNCSCPNEICEPWCGENIINSPTYCPEDCPLGYCGDGLCEVQLGENQETCPEDCGYPNPNMPNCGNGDCEPELGETWETCPADCYIGYALCGDGKCMGAENTDNCCEDCGCPEAPGCQTLKCINHKCQQSCCFIGYCCVWLGLCWYWWVLIVIIIAAAIIIYILTRSSLEKVARDLAKIRKAKNLILAGKITKVNEYAKWQIKK